MSQGKSGVSQPHEMVNLQIMSCFKMSTETFLNHKKPTLHIGADSMKFRRAVIYSPHLSAKKKIHSERKSVAKYTPTVRIHEVTTRNEGHKDAGLELFSRWKCGL